MLDEIRLLGAFALGLVVALGLTPIAIAVANRIGFADKPLGFKAHVAPTPYLGGAAVLTAAIAASVAFADGAGRYWPILIGALSLWIVGTVDDMRMLGVVPRVLAEVAAASGLWATDLGWTVFSNDLLNLLFTNLWIVGLVNAFNLMDNMDGAASSVAAVSSFGIGILALFKGEPLLAALCMAVSGACVGFLRYNLAAPARIFLGDGGSMPIGFLVAAFGILLPFGSGAGWSVLLTVLLVGLPVFDTTLVMISRRRRRVPILSGGLDHLTHRLRVRLSSARAVAVRLSLVQAALCVAAVSVSGLSTGFVIATIALALLIAMFALAVLEISVQSPSRRE